MTHRAAGRRARGTCARVGPYGLRAALRSTPLAAQAPAEDRALAELARDVERVESLRAIKTLQRLYAQYAQYGLWSEIGALFAPRRAVHLRRPGPPGQDDAGPEEIAAFLRTRYGGGHEGLEPGDTRLMMIDAPVVTLAPNGREATGRWSVLMFLGGGGKAAIEGGIFVNDYRFTDGKWRIAGARYFPQYSGPYETGWTNWGGGDLPIVPYHFTPDEAGVPVMAPEGEAPATGATLADLSARVARSTTRTRSATCRPRSATTSTARCGTTSSTCSPTRAWSRSAARTTRQGRRARLARHDGPGGLATGSSTTGRSSTWRSGSRPRATKPGPAGSSSACSARPTRRRAGGKAPPSAPLRQGRRGVEAPRAAPFSAVPLRLRPWLGADLSARPTVRADAGLPRAASGDRRTASPRGGRDRGWWPRPARSRLEPQPPPDLTLDQARTALARSLAYNAIENVSSAYGFYLDDFQSANFSGLLATDGFKMSAFAGYYVGRDRVTEAGRRVWGPAPETRAGISFHWRVQPVILVSDDGRSANQRVRLFQPRTGKEVGAANGFYGAYFYSGMYHDQYVLEDGVWRMWNLSLDEPYMGTVDWKSGWQRAKEPTRRGRARPACSCARTATSSPMCR